MNDFEYKLIYLLIVSLTSINAFVFNNVLFLPCSTQVVFFLFIFFFFSLIPTEPLHFVESTFCVLNNALQFSQNQRNTKTDCSAH